MPATIESAFQIIELPTARLAYASFGEGPPIVLLHAAGHDRHDYDAIIPELARKHRVLALDWPGWGDSPALTAPEESSAMLYARLLAEFVAALDLPPAIFIGNSVGGYAAVRLALDHPPRVRALALVNSGGFSDTGLFARNFVRLRGREWFNSATWNLFPGYYTTSRNAQSLAMLSRLRDSETESRVAALAAIWRSFNEAEHDLRQRATAVHTPTLLLWGERDPVIGIDAAEAAAAAIPGARLELLPTGHVVFVEAPQLFLDRLRPFLDSLP